MAWTDSINNTTKIRKVHISELRSKIDNLASVSCPTHNSVDYTSYKGTVKATQYTAVYGSDDSSYRSRYNSSYDTSTYATYDSSYDGGVRSSDWGWNSTNHTQGLKGPCYILKRLINKWSHKYAF